MQLSNIVRAGLAAAAVAMAGAGHAAPVTLTFEGLANLAPVGDFYGGGAGPNYGAVFGPSALALIDRDDDPTGTGNIANEPSGKTVLVLNPDNFTILNLSTAYSGLFTFFYSTTEATGTVSFYDGADATGNVVGQTGLNALGRGCNGDPNGQFACWEQRAVIIGAVGARSVRFEAGSAAGNVVFDNISFDVAPTGVPEPGSLALVGAALAGLGMARRRRAA